MGLNHLACCTALNISAEQLDTALPFASNAVISRQTPISGACGGIGRSGRQVF